PKYFQEKYFNKKRRRALAPAFVLGCTLFIVLIEGKPSAAVLRALLQPVARQLSLRERSSALKLLCHTDDDWHLCPGAAWIPPGKFPRKRRVPASSSAFPRAYTRRCPPMPCGPLDLPRWLRPRRVLLCYAANFPCRGCSSRG